MRVLSDDDFLATSMISGMRVQDLYAVHLIEARFRRSAPACQLDEVEPEAADHDELRSYQEADV
jgi:hypothetical protein